MTLAGVGALVLSAGCGASPSPTGATTPGSDQTTTSPATGSPPPAVHPHPFGAAVVITEPDGFKFKVQAAAPTQVTQLPENLTNVTLAPPGKDYVEITLQVTNVQTDRAADMVDLFGNGSGDFAQIVVPAACPNGVGGDTCSDTALALSSDGSTAIGVDELCGQCSQLQASQSENIMLYSADPFPTGISLSSIKLQFGAGLNQTDNVPLP